MKKIYFLTMPLLFLSLCVKAREKAPSEFSLASLYTLSWSLSVPAGSFSSFINNVSPAGGNFTGRYFLKSGFALGFEFGWNNYYRKYPRNTYYGGDGLAITATHYTYAFVVPWKAGAYYYFLPAAIADPYVGLSLGADYMEEHMIVQEYDIYDAQWGVTMSPEIGVLIKFGRFSHFGVQVNAQYWFNTNSFNFTGYNAYSVMQGFNFNAGLTYMLR